MNSETSTITSREEFVRVDPQELIIGANARLDPRLDREFVDSVRERGVLQAVTAYRDDDQRLVVLFGQRRTVAAVQVGRESVPVMVVEKPAEEVDRLGDQVSENDRRAGLSNADRVAAFEQMSMFGLSAGQIAKRTGTKKTEVTTALAVSKSKLATGAAKRYQFLDLRQAAVVAEFDDDKDACTQLIVAAKEGQGFDHLAQRLRDERAEAAAQVAKTAELSAAGLTIVAEPAHGDPKTKELFRLVDDEGQELEAAAHSECPGHAAFVGYSWYDEDITGENEGPRTRRVRGLTARYVCTDYAAYGHVNRYRAPDTDAQADKAVVTDAEREAKRAERRDVIQANKDWVSATTVRREWLTGFLSRKTAPKGAAAFVADSLARPGLVLERGWDLAYELIRVDGPRPSWHRESNAFADLVGKSSEARAQVLALGLVLAAYEEPLKDKSSWREPGSSTVRYLRFLQECRYELAAIEQRACGEAPDPVAPDAQA
ncbi:ParB/RepB/Spo0J family partition protein [Catenuloplanes sp. NPDC051500]|uniref:ParB/RepB/Spo0J family partition protein n=1 Tax=Catenuloplanes sp. NPDC051500 TaxID=3363959 RepID=UPI00379CBE3F